MRGVKCIAAMAVLSAIGDAVRADLPVPTTKQDFFQGGSQPDGLYDQFLSSANCGSCHGSTDENILVYHRFRGSMMAHAARDPLFYAAMAVAEQDASFVGDICIRCHVPRAWISGRSEPTDGSAINESDRDSVNCHICHRMVDPVYTAGVSPVEDESILDELVAKPVTVGGGNYVLDKLDNRRSKREDVAPPHSHLVSPFHAESDMCGTCHDVSNPAFSRQEDGTYALNDLDAAHPTDNKYDQFPLERTFSEWSMSEYAATGVDTLGRFGGNDPVVSTCQDCHMPQGDSYACFFPDVPFRNDFASHDMNGANTWVPFMVMNLYGKEDIDPFAILEGVDRSRSMLQRAATLELAQSGDRLLVKVINETGHKLPSGYPEGRRMWLNVKFLDGQGALLSELGAYDLETAELSAEGTVIYEAKLGIDDAVSQLTGIPAGETFHFALNNVILKDNRIPPRGFTQSGFAQVQSAPVAKTYLDGQHWDEMPFVIPGQTASVEVTLYYQTASKEYVTFLRDANMTTEDGQTLYDQWLITGQSAPELMVTESITLAPFADGDLDGDGYVDLLDFSALNGCISGPSGGVQPGCEDADLDGDGDVDLIDFGRWQTRE